MPTPAALTIINIDIFLMVMLMFSVYVACLPISVRSLMCIYVQNPVLCAQKAGWKVTWHTLADKPVLILHVHPFLSPSLSLPVTAPFLAASLSPVHLFLFDSFHYWPGTSSACPAKTRHWNGIWEKECVGDCKWRKGGRRWQRKAEGDQMK